MANKKFSALDLAAALSGGEIIPVIQLGVEKRTTPNDIAALAANLVDSVNGQTGVVVLTQDNVGDGTSYKQYSATEKTKLAGIAAGAEVNVNADWNSISGDSQILNKPTITGSNTGDNATNTQYSGLVSNATHTGDATGATALTLATVNANVGSFGSATQVPTYTVNAKGLTTAASNVTIQIPESQVTNLVTDLAGKAASSHTHVATTDLTATGIKDATTYLRGDNTWATPSGGAGGSPGGSTTQIQFNDASAFGGDADLTWDKTTNTLGLGGTNTALSLAGITTEPAVPAAGNLKLYSKSYAGRMMPKIIGPSGVDTPLQVAFWGNNITMWNPTTATAGVWLGTAGVGAGTYSTALPTTTSLYTATKRARWANIVTTVNQVLGQRNTEAMYFRGSIAGQGGFFFYARLGFDVWTNGGRFFAGFATATTVVSAEPSALNNTVGFCIDSTDAGAISFLTRGTAATKAPTGFTAVTGKGYDVYIFCAPNSSQYTWRIVDTNAGTEASGTATATLPTNTTMLTANVLASNAALTPVTSIQLGLNRIYVETDR